MNYINNWIAQLTAPLSANATILPISPTAAARLDLTGSYLLTLVNSMNPLEQTLWEIVEVSEGLQLKRGREGTAPQSWPADTVIYCALTAGQLTSLQERIAELEKGGGGGGGDIPDGALTDALGNTLTDANQNILTGE